MNNRMVTLVHEEAPARDSSARHVFIATPTKSHEIVARYAQSLMPVRDACRERGIGFTWNVLARGCVMLARTRQAWSMLQHPKATDLFFVDDDIVFTVDEFMAVLEAPYAIRCAMYPERQIDWKEAANALRSGRDPSDYASKFFVRGLDELELLDAPPFVRITHGPTGFMCIAREALADLTARYKAKPLDAAALLERAARDPVGVDFAALAATLRETRLGFVDEDNVERVHLFPTPIMDDGAGAQRFFSEDYGFCDLATRAGYEIMIATTTRLGHVGPCMFERAAIGDSYDALTIVLRDRDWTTTPAPKREAALRLLRQHLDYAMARNIRSATETRAHEVLARIEQADAAA